MEALGINIGYLIMQILIITIMMLLMKGLVYKPILRILDERKARIAKGLEDSRQAAIARDNADVEAKKILDTARQEAAKIRQDAVAQADETAKAIEAKANSAINIDLFIIVVLYLISLVRDWSIHHHGHLTHLSPFVYRCYLLRHRHCYFLGSHQV